MQIDSLALQLRERSNWETVDLGLAMVKHWAKPIYLTTLFLWLPFAFAILLIGTWLFGQDNVGLLLLLIWWLKPIQERLVLSVLASAIFGNTPTVRITLKQLPSLLFRSGLFADLLWGRIWPARSICLPVKQLERPKGKARRQRLKLILTGKRMTAYGMGLALGNAQLFLYGGSFLLLTWLTPIESNKSWFAIVADAQQPLLVELLLSSLFLLMDALFLPLFTASGFALYLQRRTTLEAWDLQHKLTQLGQRLQQSALGLLAALLILVPTLYAGKTFAATSQEQQADIHGKTQQILQSPEFGRYKETHSLRWVSNDDQSTNPQAYQPHNYSAAVSEKVAEAFRVVVWIVGAGFISWLVIRLFRHWQYGRSAPSSHSDASAQLVFGLDVNPDNLPNDIPAAALQLLAQGKQREAMSLLYRGALVYWLDNGLAILPGDTEGDCIQRVARLSSQPARDFFTSLVSGWQRIAYGHQQLPVESISQLANQWATHYPKATTA